MGGLCPRLLLLLKAKYLGCVLILATLVYPLCCLPTATMGSWQGHGCSMGRCAVLRATLASPVSRYSPLAEQFSHQFPAHDLPSVLAKFSLPVSLSEFRNPLTPPVQEVSCRSLGSPGTTHLVMVPKPRALRAAAPLASGGLPCRCCLPCHPAQKPASWQATRRRLTREPTHGQSRVPPTAS